MAIPQLNVMVSEGEECTRVTLIGPVDSSTFDEYKEALQPLCREGAPKVVINCSQLSYINSKGIGFLANLHRMLMIRMGNLALFGVSSRIMKTLELLGLSNRLHIFATEEEALAALKEE